MAKHDKQPGQKPREGAPQEQGGSRRPGFDEIQDDTTRQEPGLDQPNRRQPGAFEPPDEAEGAEIDREKGPGRSDREAGAGRPVQLDDDEDGQLARK